MCMLCATAGVLIVKGPWLKNPPSVTATGQDTQGKMRMDQSFQNENTAKQKNFKEKMCAIMSF